MNMAWALCDSTQLPPKYTAQQLHDTAPIWSSWRLWRSFQSDNCVVAGPDDIKFCLDHELYRYCNLYIPDTHQVDQPLPLRRYARSGGAGAVSADHDIVLHLAAGLADLVLLLGFDSPGSADTDKLLQSLVTAYTSCQWVYIVSPGTARPRITGENFTCDNLDQVLKSLTS